MSIECRIGEIFTKKPSVQNQRVLHEEQKTPNQSNKKDYEAIDFYQFDKNLFLPNHLLLTHNDIRTFGEAF